MRVLITGAGGQLGQELVEVFDQPHHEVVAAPRNRLDVADRDQVMGAITQSEPDVIVHAGGWTAVDDCESDPDRAFGVNALGTRHVVSAARMVGAKVIYVSTDYVFDGTAEGAYNEWAMPNPQSVYGRSKLGGEMELGPDDLCVRTSWVFGRHGNNVVKTVLKLTESSDQLRFVNDQHGKPTCAADLAQRIYELTVGRARGTFHVTNEGPTTWFDFARTVLELSGHDPNRVDPVATADLKPARPAQRPLNSILDNAASRLQGMAPMAHHRDALERTLKELLSQ